MEVKKMTKQKTKIKATKGKGKTLLVSYNQIGGFPIGRFEDEKVIVLSAESGRRAMEVPYTRASAENVQNRSYATQSENGFGVHRFLEKKVGFKNSNFRKAQSRKKASGS